MILNIGCGKDTRGDVRADIRPTSATTICFDANEKFPFTDESFDIVLSECLFEHLGNPKNFLQECKRVLKKNGRLCIVTDNASHWRFHFSRNYIIRLGWIHSDEYIGYNENDKHFALFQLGHIRNYIQSINMKLVRLELINYDGTTKPINKLDRFFCAIGLRNLAFPRIYAVCSKLAS